MAQLSNILSCWAGQYGSIDTSNINISQLVIILWQNILGQRHVALHSLLTTLPNKNFYRGSAAALYYTAVGLEKRGRQRTNRQRTFREERIQLQRPLSSPMDRRFERANTI